MGKRRFRDVMVRQAQKGLAVDFYAGCVDKSSTLLGSFLSPRAYSLSPSACNL